MAWKPIYAAVLAVVVIALVIGAVFFLKRRADFQARQTPPQVSPGTTPDNRTANVPSPPATPTESPADKPTSAEAVVVLNDR